MKKLLCAVLKALGASAICVGLAALINSSGVGIVIAFALIFIGVVAAFMS